MTELGYSLSSEEHPGSALVDYARRAEETGFTFALISDHFHPWLDEQGQSPFVWSVLGGIARETERLRVGTAVTCPIMRIHPAIIAQAAASTAEMFGDRFFLGLGSGERLNEHVLAQRWPPVRERLDMLEEAIEVIARLWEGETTSYEGQYFEVEDARIYTLPRARTPICVAAAGRRAARIAGRDGDGLIAVVPSEDLVEAFEKAGGAGKPRYAQVRVCYAESERKATDTVMKVWPTDPLPGVLNAELSTPAQFAQAAKMVRPEMLGEKVALGPDPERHMERIRSYVEAGFDHVYVHQVGPDQEGFFRFYEREIMPHVGRLTPAGRTA
jgi:coenzyme F420-dependent glucose-6-phosphate dehydrogenase